MNTTQTQWLAIAAVVLNALVGASTLWTSIFGQADAAIVISILGLINTILAGITFVLTGQAAQIKNAAAMPGVERISVGTAANQTLAQVAIDHSQSKVQPTEAAKSVVQDIARG